MTGGRYPATMLDMSAPPPLTHGSWVLQFQSSLLRSKLPARNYNQHTLNTARAPEFTHADAFPG